MTTRDGDLDTSRSAESDGAAREEPRAPSAAERATLAISAALVLAVVGLLLVLQATGGAAQPTFEATPLAEEVRREGDAWYLPISVANRGDRTAEQVLVRVELAAESGSPETAEFTIDFLPGGETAEGTVVFPSDPLAGDLAVGVASFR